MFIQNFEAISHVTLVLGPEPPRKFNAKSGLIHQRLLVGQKTFHTVNTLFCGPVDESFEARQTHYFVNNCLQIYVLSVTNQFVFVHVV